jgi:pre-mRNA-splicing factor ATP-dependent RNA helicase DHX38/PRP16
LQQISLLIFPSVSFLVYRDQIRRVVRLPNLIPIEYKRHQDSLEDRSSYRNPTMVWRAPAKSHNMDGGGDHRGGHRSHRDQDRERGDRNYGDRGGDRGDRGNYRGNMEGGGNRYHNNSNDNRGGGGERREGGGDYGNRPAWKSPRWTDPNEGVAGGGGGVGHQRDNRDHRDQQGRDRGAREGNNYRSDQNTRNIASGDRGGDNSNTRRETSGGGGGGENMGDASGWRKVGASGKPEPYGRSGLRSGSYGEAANNANDNSASSPTSSFPKGGVSTSTDGWTKVRNPFTKQDN